MVIAADSSTEGESLPCCSLRRVDSAWWFVERPGTVGLSVACFSKARLGNSCRRQHRGLRLPLLLSTGSGQGTVGKAKAGLGVDWLGKVKAADGSTEGAFRRPFCLLALYCKM